MGGKHFPIRKTTENDPMAQMREFEAKIETQKAKVCIHANQAIDELDVTDEDYSEKMNAIINKRRENLKVLEQFSGPQQPEQSMANSSMSSTLQDSARPP